MDPATFERFPLFRSLDDDERARVAALAQPLAALAGTLLFDAGDPPDSFYFIEKGTVRIRVPAADGQVEKRITLKAGSFFGEIGLLRDRPRMGDADVVMDGRLLRFDRGAFDELLSVDEALARKISDAVRLRLGEYREAAEDGRAEPRVLLFMTPGNREGASFITANLAVKLRIATGKPTLAVDLHFEKPGLQRFLSTLSNLGSFSQIFASPEITGATIEHAAAALPLGLHLLAGSGTGSIALTPAHLEELLPKTRENFEWVLIDPGPRCDEMTAVVARFADVAHIVCAPTEASIAGAEELGRWLTDQGLEGRIRYILNRVPTEGAELDPEAIEKVLGEDLIGTIHHSEIQKKQGVVAGAPVVATHPRSQVGAEVTGLTRSLISQPKGPLERLRDLLLWTLGYDG